MSEADRLAVLRSYDILDTPPERAFDDIVMLAREVVDVPIALVSLVEGDRQWFKARLGLEAHQTPIGSSVCAHAIRSGELLVIPDLTEDERTRDNPLVMDEPKIRFYAGAVIRTSQGIPLGTVCVIDTKPRPAGLTPGQADALLALARQTMAQIEMRRAVDVSVTALAAERRASSAAVARAEQSDEAVVTSRAEEKRLRLAQEAGLIGTFEIEIATDIARVSDEFCRIYGLPSSRELPSSLMESLVVSDGNAKASTKSERSDGSAALYAEYRIRRANDGAQRWIARQANFRFNAEGKAAYFIGAVQDITARKVTLIRQDALLRLGDRLRQVGSTAEVLRVASEILGTTLLASRAGYAFVDLPSGRVTIEHDWSAEGVASLAGERSMNAFMTTLDHLKAGRAIAFSEIPKMEWLKDDAAGYRSIDAQAQIAVPLLRNNQLVGVLYAHSTTNRDWNKEEIDFATAVADRAFAAIEKNQAEAEQNILNHELSHRLKNSFAMVQAIAGQTLRDAADKNALDAFNARISALSTAHDILIRQRWTAARIQAVIDEGVTLHAAKDRFTLQGPNLRLGPKAVLSLSLLVHELATNATKYGALANSNGKINIVWEIEQQGPAPVLVLTWQETDGPPVTAPRQRGFGSRLMRMGLSGTGNAELRYDPIGLTARFAAPLSILVTDEA